MRSTNDSTRLKLRTNIFWNEVVGALLILAAIAGPGNPTTSAKNNAILAKMFAP
jgi:hypothetical protein